MNIAEKLTHYGDTYHPKWLDLIRVLLGVLIFIKGLNFVSDRVLLINMIDNSSFAFWSFMLVHYIIFAHLVGGLFVAIGFLTRIAVAVQIPILFGAVFFVNIPNSFAALNTEFLFALLVLVLLLFFLVYGSGPLSIDRLLKRENVR